MPLLLALAGCPGPPPPAGPRFTVRLTEVGPDRAAVVAAVASRAGYQPEVARRLVEQAAQGTPVPLGVGLPEAEARAQLAALEAAGARASLSRVPE